MKAVVIDRWLTFCRHCTRRATWNGPSAPREHRCPALGPEAVAGFESVARITWRYLPSRGNCRQAEPRHIPALPEPKPGECSWACRGSLSPICYCPGCGGAEHGILNIATENTVVAHIHLPREEPDIIDQIIARTPGHDYPRRARKST
jgi:hypothetical protein